jgi:hypothetical protein
MVVLARHRALLVTLLRLVCCCLLFAGAAQAQDPGAELQIKAAFVHKFVTYVEGGPDTAFGNAQGPVAYGVAGSEDLRQFLTQLVAARNDGRPAEVRSVESVTDIDGLHVLFVGPDASDTEALLSAAVAASILTVTDTDGPQPANSMIRFLVADDRVRFDIALAPVEAAGLKLSSRLLQVARRVIPNE